MTFCRWSHYHIQICCDGVMRCTVVRTAKKHYTGARGCGGNGTLSTTATERPMLHGRWGPGPCFAEPGIRDPHGRLATWTGWLSFNPKTIYTRRLIRQGGVPELTTNTVHWDFCFDIGAGTKMISSSSRDSLVGGAGGEQAHGVPFEPRRLHLRLQRPCGRPPEGPMRGGRRESEAQQHRSGKSDPVGVDLRQRLCEVSARRGPCVPIVVRDRGEGTDAHGSAPPPHPIRKVPNH